MRERSDREERDVLIKAAMTAFNEALMKVASEFDYGRWETVRVRVTTSNHIDIEHSCGIMKTRDETVSLI